MERQTGRPLSKPNQYTIHGHAKHLSIHQRVQQLAGHIWRGNLFSKYTVVRLQRVPGLVKGNDEASGKVTSSANELGQVYSELRSAATRLSITIMKRQG